MRKLFVTPEAAIQTARRRLAALRWPSRSTIVATLLLCIAFYVAAQIGLALHFPASLVYFVWPPSVLVFVALVLSPRRDWWIYFLALLPVHLLVEWNTVSAPPASLVLFYAAVWAQALAGALCIERFAGRPLHLATLRLLIIFLLSGAAAAAVTEAATLATILDLTTRGANFWLTFIQTVLADALTMVVLAPALVSGWAFARGLGLVGDAAASGRDWLTSARRGVHGWLQMLSTSRVAEAGLLALGIVAVGLVAFGGYITLPSTLPALLYAILPLLLWAAVRFGLGGTSLALCGLTLLSILYAIHGRGPFTAFSTTENLISLQLFSIAISVPLLVLAVIMRERRQAQEELEQSEERYRAVVSNFPNGAVLLFDAELRHLFADGQGMRSDGTLGRVWVGSTVWDAFPAAVAAHLAPRYQTTLAGIPATFDVVANERTYYVQTAPIRQKQRTEGMVVLQDVTEQRRAETLAELDRAKTVFFSNISHELRTPLTLLLGPAVDSLADREEPLPSRQRERLELIHHSGLRLYKLVNTLLDFSRIEAGRVQTTYEPTDLAALTAELTSSFRSAVERAGLVLIVDCPPLTALSQPVYVDREMWEKIVLNLLSNALKFTFAGAITVSLRAAGDQGNWVELEVRDTGTGIPAEELPHLFERFRRVQGARARTQEGTGIGLALVWELARLHGGMVRVTSVLAAGSSFIVALPTGSDRLRTEHLRDMHSSETSRALPGMESLTSTVWGATPFVEEALRWLPDVATPETAVEAAAVPTDTMAEMRGHEPQGSLPAAHDGAHRGAATQAASPGTGTTGPLAAVPGSHPDSQERILVADDNADMRAYLTRLLSERWVVEGVADGLAALAAAHARPPDLVLADVMMPGLDGFALLHALRADPATSAIPVLLLSARAGEEATVEGLEAGADDYLVKPFAARELLARVQSHLDLALLRREAAAHAAQLDAIFEAQADGVAVFDLQGRFVRANAALHHLLGFDADDEYTSQPLEERAQRLRLFDEQDQPLLPEEWPQWRVLRGELLEGASAVDGRVRTVDGRELWVSITGAPIRGPDGQVTGVVLISRDVTARRVLERQVQEQAGELEAIFEAQADGVVVYSQYGHLVRANRAWQAIFRRYAEILGLSADPQFNALSLADQITQVGRHPTLDGDGKIIPTEQLPTARALRGETVNGSRAVEELVHSPDGRVLRTSVSAAPVRDPAGHIREAVVVVRDVTTRRELERRVAEQERLFRTLVEHSPDIIARFDRELRYLYVSPAIRQISPVLETAYRGKTNAELGWPEDAYGPAHRAIEQVFQTGQPQTLEESDAAFSGAATARYFRAQILPERATDGRVESVLTVTTDITALKRTEQALRAANASLDTARQEEERRKQIAESLRGVLTALNSKRPSQEVLQYIVRQAEELLGSAAAVIYGPDHLTDSMSPGAGASTLATTLRVQAAEGLRIGGRRPRPYQRLPFLDSAVEQVLASAQPVALVDLRGDPSFGQDANDEADADTAIPCLDGVLPAPYHALLVVPIRVHDGLYGCLLLFYPQPHHFVAEEVALAQAYADQVAQAITNARLQAQLEQEAAAAERNHLARELHDTVKQDLFSASLLAESLPTVWQTHRAEAEVGLRQLHMLTQSALAGLHALLLELRPAALEQSPLSEALRKLGTAMATRAGVPILVEVEGAANPEPPLPATVKVAFYRVAQESLMNAAKYAKAHTIRVQLRANGTRSKSWLELEIADDGRGFDPAAIPAGHFGLTIMHERAQAVGASIQVRSRAGQGTVVVMSWRSGRKVIASGRAVGAAIAVGGTS